LSSTMGWPDLLTNALAPSVPRTFLWSRWRFPFSFFRNNLIIFRALLLPAALLYSVPPQGSSPRSSLCPFFLPPFSGLCGGHRRPPGRGATFDQPHAFPILPIPLASLHWHGTLPSFPPIRPPTVTRDPPIPVQPPHRVFQRKASSLDFVLRTFIDLFLRNTTFFMGQDTSTTFSPHGFPRPGRRTSIARERKIPHPL